MENKMDEVTVKVKQVLSDVLLIDTIEDIKPENYLVDDYGMDSLDAIDIMIQIEDEFGVDVDEGKIKNIKTVQDIIDCVNKYRV